MLPCLPAIPVYFVVMGVVAGRGGHTLHHRLTEAKMLGYFSPEIKQVELTAGQGAVQAKLESLPDSELFKIMSMGQAVAP